MIQNIDQTYILHTAHTSYALRVTETGHLEHLHYGGRITVGRDIHALVEKHSFAPGNTNIYDPEHSAWSLEDFALEMSSYGKGDIREPFVELTFQDGSSTADFLFQKAEISQTSGPVLTSMPSSYSEAEASVDCLTVTLKDSQRDVLLLLSYFVYEDCDVITRTSRIINNSGETIRLERLLSLQLDFHSSDYTMTSFHGGWVSEMQRVDQPVQMGKIVNASITGGSSSRANPFVMLSTPGTTEDFGEAYGFNLVYSGNHYECAEATNFGKLRFVSGINPQNFSFLLEPGDQFEAPEAVMTWSDEGFNGMSQHMHDFVREHIVRGQWQHKERPILVNSWEACYFDISERKLMGIANVAKDLGAELFVVDDGWFGERNDDKSSLGDWTPNAKKFPGGLAQISDKIHGLGLQFGIWVEPEMVSLDSDLYRAHPDWAIEIPGQPHSEGRSQRILDLTRQDVQDHLIQAMTEVFESARIEYVKWDMNRTFTDVFSQALPADRQGEVFHRYIIGLYRIMSTLTRRFPAILFEGCAAGGNRFDLGILSYFPQIWGSDNSDPLTRQRIQTCYSYGYPLSTVSAHVSDIPNHQTLREMPKETRFAVSAFGVLGYECNLKDLKSEYREAIRDQITLYKEWHSVFFGGRFYRGRTNYGDLRTALTPSSRGITEWTVVSRDQTRAAGFLGHQLFQPNTQYQYYRARGLAPDKLYHFTNHKFSISIRAFGGLINTASPVHIRPGSLAHDLAARIIKYKSEIEDYTCYGDALMRSGVKLASAFSAVGYDESVRLFRDFSARLYLMEEVSEPITE